MATTSEQSSSFSKRIGLIGVSLAAGLILGVFAVFAIQHLMPKDKQSSQDAARGGSQQTSTNSTDDSGTAVAKQIAVVLQNLNVSGENITLYSNLYRASEEELGEWWIQSHSIERKLRREIAQDAILRRLTAINPQTALTYVEELSTFQSVEPIRSVFSEWSILQLDEAIEAATTLSDSQRSIALEAILDTRDDLPDSRRRTIAIQLDGEEAFLKRLSDAAAFKSMADPIESWEILLNDEVTDYLQLDSLIMVAEAWYEQIGLDVLLKISQSEFDDLDAQRRLLSTMARVDLAGALDYTSGLAVHNLGQFLSKIVVSEWARIDARAALEAISTFESVSLVSVLEQEIAQVWAQTNPRELIENIEMISEEIRFPALETAFGRFARQDPLDAIEKLSMVEEFVGNTSSIIVPIVSAWAFKEPEAAAEWVVNQYSPDDPQRRRLMQSVLMLIAPKDPDRAFELATAHPSQTGGGYPLDLVVIRTVAFNGDIDAAKKLLTRVKETEDHHNAHAEVGEAMIVQGQYSEAVELGRELSERKQLDYFNRIASTWARNKPTVLYKYLEDLPTSNAKSRAAFHLIWANTREPVLSDEQVATAKTLLGSHEKASVEAMEKNK